MSELMLDVGQANELKMAFRREGPWTNEEIKMLCERKGFLTMVHDVMLGRCQINIINHIVDLDADPFIPEGWKVESHTKGGQFKFDPAKVKLHLDEGQKDGKWIKGTELRKKLKKVPVYNANLLDFYLKNPHLIPEDWKKGKVVYFWGTIYRLAVGRLCVRCLYWNGDRWLWRYGYLESDWGDSFPAACGE